MAWAVELSEAAVRELGELDRARAKRITKFLQPVSKLENPRTLGQALRGSRLGEFWKYRPGDYRLTRRIEDNRLLVLVLRIGHRREVDR
jgi:mRNA interferase RelE/StbE